MIKSKKQVRTVQDLLSLLKLNDVSELTAKNMVGFIGLPMSKGDTVLEVKELKNFGTHIRFRGTVFEIDFHLVDEHKNEDFFCYTLYT